MAMGREGEFQDDLVMTWAELPRSPGHVFYDRLQRLLAEVGFDARSGQGLKIMHDLAEKLAGTIELAPRSPGASLRLTFPITPAQGDNIKPAEADLGVP
jgi:hypothetical protein